MAAKVASYVKNVGKSIAFSTIDVLKENTEGISNFIEESNNITKSVYGSIKKIKDGKKSEEQKDNKILSAVESTVKNFIKSVKTGDFYNKALDDEAVKDMMGEDFLDFGDDFNFDDDSFSSSSSSSSSDDDYNSDSMMTSAIGAAAAVNATAVAQSTDAIIKTTRISNKALLSRLEVMNASLSSNIGALYNQASTTNEFLKGPMTTHLENSKTYYENMTKMMQEQVAMMKEIIDTNRKIYGDGKDKSNKSNILGQSINPDGSMNIDGYLKNIKKNFENSYYGSMLGMVTGGGGGGDGNGLKIMLNGLQRMGLNFLIGDKILGKKFQESIHSFDKGLSSLFSNLVVKANTKRDNYENSILSILGEFLGLSVKNKTSINTGNYNKGPVPFDGITRKAITEVIPGYLARIEAALTGRSKKAEKYYDYNTGKWSEYGQVEKNFKSEEARAINESVSEIRGELYPLIEEIRKKNTTEAKEFEEFMNKMAAAIYKDGGDFRPQFEDVDKRISGGDAWIRYGAKSKEQFDQAMKRLSNNTIRRTAYKSLKAKEDLSNRLQAYEDSGSIYDILFNRQLERVAVDEDMWKSYGAKNKQDFEFALAQALGNVSSSMDMKRSKYMQTLIDRIKRDDSVFDMIYRSKNDDGSVDAVKRNGGMGILASSRDEYGKNIFYYLREILNKIDRNRTANAASNVREFRKPTAYDDGTVGVNNGSGATEESSESSGEDDPEPDDMLYMYIAQAEEEERKRKEEEMKSKPSKWKKYLREKFGDTKVGQWWLNRKKKQGVDTENTNALFKGPFEYMAGLIDKADNAIFKLIFGENKYKDDEGNEIDNVFEYIIYKIKKSFKELSDWLKEKVFNPLSEKLKKFYEDKIKPKWDTYVKPTLDQTGEYIKSGWNRTKEAFGNTFGKGFNKIKQNVIDHNDVKKKSTPVTESAEGRIVTKRGLTMISPGEIIIPASFDKRKQKQDLRKEKEEKSKIEKELGFDLGDVPFNAEGNMTKEEIKQIVDEILATGKDTARLNAHKITAGGLIGGGASLIAGLNPILGALVGAVSSFVNHSSAAKDLLFGKQDQDGKRSGKGIIPKKVLQIFSKYGSDMLDFGVAGGVLGLISPLGILGTAAVGAGIGFLKNNEAFKKFVFGDLESGKDGLISKDAYKKFKDKLGGNKKQLIIGAGVGLLGGPFGVLGNMVLGAAAGLATTTNLFHQTMFGDGTEDNKGVIGAIQAGVIDPFKKKGREIIEDLNDFLKTKIASPFEEFVRAMTQDIKNVIKDIGDGIKDGFTSMIRAYLGVPLRDFLLQRVFKPITKTLGFVLKGPYALAKGAVALPFQMLGSIGRMRRASQISKGKAYDMSAEERIEYRNQNKRSKLGYGILKGFGIDKTLGQDQILAGMSQEQLSALNEYVKGASGSREDIETEFAQSVSGVKRSVSSYFNTTDENGKNLYDKIGWSKTKKLYDAITSGNEKEFDRLIKGSNLSEAEKEALKEKIGDGFEKLSASKAKRDAMNLDEAETNKKLGEILGHEVKGKKDSRQLRRVIDAELKARTRKEASTKLEIAEAEAAKDPAEKTADNTAKINDTIKQKADELLEVFKQSNAYLKYLATGDATSLNETANYNKQEEIAKSEIEALEDFHHNEFIKNAVEDVQSVSEEGSTNTEKIIKSDGKAFKGRKGKRNKNRGVTGYTENVEYSDTIEEASGYKTAVANSEEYKNILNQFGLEDPEVRKDDDPNNEDSKEAKEEEKKKEEAAKDEKEELEHTKKASEILKELKDKLVGGERDSGIIGKLGNGFGKILKWLGIGGATVAGIAASGYASEWFETAVWPTIKKGLFGTTNEDGTRSGGVVPAIGAFLLGDKATGEPGLFGKITSWLGDRIKDISTWFNEKFPTFLSEKVLPVLINGIGLAAENIVAPLTTALLVATPKIVGGVVKGLWDYMTGKTKKYGNEIGNEETVVNRETAKEYGLKVREDGQIVTEDGTEVKNSGFTRNDKTIANRVANATGRSFLKTAGGITTNTSPWLSRKLSKIGINGFKKIPTSVGGAVVGFTKTGVKAGVKGAATAINASGELGSKFADTFAHSEDRFKNMIRSARGLEVLDQQSLVDGRVEAANDLIKNINDNSWIAKVKNKFGVGKVKDATEAVADTAKKAAKKENFISKGVLAIKNGASRFKDRVATNMAGDLKDIFKNNRTAQRIVENVKSDNKALKEGLQSIFEKVAKSKVGDKILSLMGFGESLRGKLTKALLNVAEDLATKAGGKIGAKACAKLVGVVAKFNPLGLAMLIYDFIEGVSNAASILGVAKDDYAIGNGEKIICGLLNVITANFTLGLIDPGLIVDILMDHVLPVFGYDNATLRTARDNADDVLAKWNAEHPDEQYETLEEYNKKDAWTTKVKKKFKGFWDSIVDKVKGNGRKDSGSGRQNSVLEDKIKEKEKKLAGGSRHNYQKSKGIANIPYGDSTIGESGCAPVAASNVVNRIRNTGYSSVADAASYAERNNMTVPGGGTDINYFNHYFNSKGIPNYSTSNRKDVMNAINSGNQVVMLGKDSSSSKNAPFGTNPHFITAVGTDRRGNIIAEDPDLPQSTVVYNKNKVLGSMIRSVVTGRSRGSRRSPVRKHLRRMAGRARGTCGAESILNIAWSQIGTVATGSNQVIYNDVYYGQKVSGANYMWCCVFVWWVFNQAGAGHLLHIKTGRCRDLLKEFTSRGQDVSYEELQPGDIAFMNFDGGTTAYHVGIVTGIDEKGNVCTIDGNTTQGNSNDPPYGVFYKSRPRKYFVGFARPEYPYEYDDSNVVDMTKYGDKTDYYSMAMNNTEGEIEADIASTSQYSSVTNPEPATNAATSAVNQVANTSSNSNNVKTVNGVPVVSSGVSGYVLKSDAQNSSAANNASVKHKYESIGDIFNLFTQLGTNIFKAWLGEDRYNALFGKNTEEGGEGELSVTDTTYLSQGESARDEGARTSTESSAPSTASSSSSSDIFAKSTEENNYDGLSQAQLDAIQPSETAAKSGTNTVSSRPAEVNGMPVVSAAVTKPTTAVQQATTSVASSGNTGSLAGAVDTANGNHVLTASDNAKFIWNYLANKGEYTKAGLAGILGNLEQESGFKPANLENTFEWQYGDDDTYTKKVNSGEYTRDDFANGHKCGYGLPGWTWHSLKAGLWDATVGQNKSLGDLEAQTEYLYSNIKEQYPGLHKILTSTNDYNTAADAMLEQYERPYGFSQNASKTGWSENPDHIAARNREYNTRRGNAQRAYSTYAGEGRNPGISVSKALAGGASRTVDTGLATDAISSANTSVTPTMAPASHTATGTVDYTTFLETIVEVLLSIADNTAMLNKIINILSENFDIKVDPTDVSSARTEARSKAKQNLNDLIKRTNGNNIHASNLLENRDTASILAQMSALARE